MVGSNGLVRDQTSRKLQLALLAALAGMVCSLVVATSSQAKGATSEVVEKLDAHEAVREGNRRLLAGSPEEALEAYQHAEVLSPEAREIAFVEGLAHYDLKEWSRAREAFQKTAGVNNDALAADAHYSLGACDHAEALDKTDDPKFALSLLENAMGRYQDVLVDQPDHKAARDAHRKAATMWRQLKQQMQQQPPQDSNQQQDKNEKNKDQPQDPSDDKQDSSPSQDSQEQQDEASAQQDQQQDQQPSESSDPQDQQSEQTEVKSAKREEVSREQAERRIREMMQAIRDRRKARREPLQRVPAAPVEKDW